MSEYFTFDGKKSSDFGVMISGNGVWNAPARRGMQISVPGRNGDVWVDDGAYENIVVTYPCYIADGFADKVDEFRAWLAAHSYDYYRLFDTYHAGGYRNARFLGPLNTAPGTRNLTGKFDVSFDCLPFMTDRTQQAVQFNGRFDRPDVFRINNASYMPADMTIIVTPPSGETDSYEIRVQNGTLDETIYMNNITEKTNYSGKSNSFSQGGSVVISPELYTTGGEIYCPYGETTITLQRTASTAYSRECTGWLYWWIVRI